MALRQFSLPVEDLFHYSNSFLLRFVVWEITGGNQLCWCLIVRITAHEVTLVVWQTQLSSIQANNAFLSTVAKGKD